MTRSERRKRDRRIVADRARGMHWAEVADRHGVSERQAQRVVEAVWTDHPAELDVEPTRIVRETLDAFAQDLTDLAVLSVETRNDSIRLGAIKARGDVFP